MSPISQIIIILILILIGLMTSANNTVHSLFSNYVFYRNTFATRMLRPIGILIALSSILIPLGHANLCLLFNTLIVLFITFFSIRGRNHAYRQKLNAREQLLREYQAEIRAKREHIESLKQNRTTVTVADNNDSKTVDTIKKKAWNDGSLTNKELIDGLTKK